MVQNMQMIKYYSEDQSNQMRLKLGKNINIVERHSNIVVS